MEIKNRDATFDIMKFIGIMLVIVGHMASTGQRIIFSFHMPLFFIIAGYFFHRKDTLSSIRSDLTRLICPYAFTCATIVITFIVIKSATLCVGISLPKNNIDPIYWLIASLYGSGSIGHTSMFFSAVPAIGAIWFLLALFWCKNIFNCIFRITRYWLPLSIVFACAAIVIDNYIINLPFAILPGVSAMIFYSIGVIIRERGGFLKISPFLWSAIVIVWIVDFLFSDMSMVRCYYKDFLINIIGACGGTFIIFLISGILSTFHGKVVKLMIWGGKIA